MKNKFTLTLILKSLFFSLLIGIIINIGCRNIVDKVIDKNLKISFDVKVENDDELKIYFNNRKAYNEISTKTNKLKGGGFLNQIRLEIPYCDTATYLRLDPSTNSLNNIISIDNLSISAGATKIIIGKNNFNIFFKQNDFVSKIDGNYFSIILNTITRTDSWALYDPFIESKNLNNLIIYSYDQYFQKINISSIIIFILCFLYFIFKKNISFIIFKSVFISTIITVSLYYTSEKINNNYIGKKIFLSFDVKVNSDDEFQVFYSKNAGVFKEEESKIFKVKGLKSTKINIEIPYNDTSTFIRIDPGSNSENNTISIENCILESGSTQVLMDKNLIEALFSKNDFISTIDYGVNSLIFKTSKKEGLWSEYDPFIISKNLNDVIIVNQKNLSNAYLLHIIIFLLILAIFIHLINNYKEYEPIKNITINIGCILFICLITLPQVDKYLCIYSNIDENRSKVNEIEFSFKTLETYPVLFTKYYEENFGFRSALIHLRSYIFVNILKESPYPDKVVFGKNERLFHNDPNDLIVKDYTHNNLLNDKELSDLLQKYIVKKKILDSLGIKYYQTFYPNSQTIYPESISDKRKLLIKGKISRVDQIINYYKINHLESAIIDHRQILLSKKDSTNLYMKHDTHWNQLAAFYSFNNLMKQINHDFNQVYQIPQSSYNIKNIKIKGGDLINLLGLKSTSNFEENAPIFYPKNDSLKYIIQNSNYTYKKYFEENPTDYPSTTFSTINPKAKNKLKVIVFRDSFTKAMYTFLSAEFYNVIYVWKDYDLEIIKKEMPNLVIDSKVERYALY